MPGYTRQQLKQDRFAETAKETVSWAVEHRNKLVFVAIAVVVIAVVVVGGWFYLDHRDQQASVEMGTALRTYQSPLRPAGTPEQPGVVTFTSAAERAQAAQKAFCAISDNYPHTRSAEFAHYYIGLTYRDMGDYANAEKELKQMAGSRKQDLAALGRFALASVYRQSNRDADAIKLYQDLIAHPTATVPKAVAQLELASLYQAKQPTEAARIYDEIRKEDPQGAAAEVAASRANQK